MLPAAHARQLSAKINVQIMDGQEVFGQHEDTMALSSQLGGH
jgi:hypothetical protein